MTINSNRKGKAFEREIARRLSEAFGRDCHRGHQERDGADAPDICNVPSWWVECKHCKRVDRRKAYEQANKASSDANNSDRVVVVWRENRGPIRVTVELSDLINTAPAYGFLVELDFADWLAQVSR